MTGEAIRQVAGLYHRRVGDIIVTALNDGHQDVAMATVLGIAPEDAAAMLHAAFRPVPRRTTVNGFGALGFVSGSGVNHVQSTQVGIEMVDARVQYQHVSGAQIGVRGTKFFTGKSRGNFAVFVEHGLVEIKSGQSIRKIGPGEGVDIATDARTRSLFGGDLSVSDPNEEPAWVQRGDGSWLIDGMMPLSQVHAVTGIHDFPGADEAHVQTLGGFIMSQLKRIPEPADRVALDSFILEVMDMDGRRVDKVLVTNLAEAE